MRRLLIFVMLGIILYSTFTSLMPSWPEPHPYRVLIDTVYGIVPAGNFSYWTLAQKGPLLIELLSVTGDADLFIGGSNLRPSFEADRNNFSSETCGIDLVYIPENFPRPLVIGVYGHWQYNMSEYSMKVFTDLVRPKTDQSPLGFSNDRKTSATHSRMVENTRSNVKEKHGVWSDILSRKDDEKPKYLQLFKVLDTMFGLLV